jgi:hypothetical protein
MMFVSSALALFLFQRLGICRISSLQMQLADYVNPPPVALLEYLCTLGVADAAGNAKPAFGRVLAAAAAARI